MKNSGAPALFGACLASAAIHQCSCFTSSPHLTRTTSSFPSRCFIKTSHPIPRAATLTRDRRCRINGTRSTSTNDSRRTTMVAKSSGSDNDAANVDAEETRQSSPTHRRRRRTRLASTKST
ncbi:unnamed protein product, partial [Sphacelaria rigidula]